jgi:hypothetical protein
MSDGKKTHLLLEILAMTANALEHLYISKNINTIIH